MTDSAARRAREAVRPRRGTVSAELGANASLQDGEVLEVSARETQAGPGRPTPADRMERRNSAPQGSYQRHMPLEVLKMPIPRKTKEKRALLQYVSAESREFEDMKTILTSSYLDTNSSSCFTYSKPRLVDSELLEKEFVEKRKEMKSDGRTDKELEESYCFLLVDSFKLPWLCEKGLLVGHSRITVLGNPSKGVYLSRYSDLIQMDPLTPGATGEIVIFKVMKGKVKSIYENMKNLMDPTPRFDSHISKNSSKVTSLSSYRAFELTQQYFYEYMFDELRQRPRQVYPYAVISFQFKGKDSNLPNTPMAPIRLNSQSAEGNKDRTQFTVWTGDLVKGDRVLFQISFHSFSPPLLPHRLPEKLEIKWVMRLDHVTKLLPSDIFSFKMYNSSQEVVNSGHYCSLLEVTDKSRSTTSVTKLLQELEVNRVVLVFPLMDRGFLFLLSSVQMAPPTERGENWKRCLQALFVFPEPRNVVKSKFGSDSSSAASESVMPRLSQFIPALHHSLVKVRANPPPELSAGVERQAREYLMGLKEGKVRQYPMGDYESTLNEQGKFSHHRGNLDGYLHPYLYSPAFYLLSVARAKHMVEMHCGPEEPQEARRTNSYGGQREATNSTRDRQANNQKVQQLIDLVLTCKGNAENEVNREEAGRGGMMIGLGRKRRLEQEKAERAIKYLKASQEYGKHSQIRVEGNQVSAPPGSLASALHSVGLKDMNLNDDGCELAARLRSLLTGLSQAARGTASQSPGEMPGETQREPCPFDGLAAKLGLPTNCDIDLRKQEELEEQTAGSVSSLEGFSPGSHGGESNHHGAACRVGGWLGRREGGYGEEEEEWAIPWVLIPISGLSSERYSSRDRNIPQDPRFQNLAATTSNTTETKPSKTSPTPSPEPSSPPSPSQCPSPDPSPYSSPSQCPSPESSPPLSLSQCPSPEPSSPPSPPLCPSPQPRPLTPPSRHLSSHLRRRPSPSRCQTVEPNKPSLLENYSSANEEHSPPTTTREFEGVSKSLEEKSYRSKQPIGGPLTSTSIQQSIPLAPKRTSISPNTTEREKQGAQEKNAHKKINAEHLAAAREPLEKVIKSAKVEQVAETVLLEEHKITAGGDKEQKAEAKKLPNDSLFSPSSSSSPPTCPLGHIDNLIDKHQGDLSTEIQFVLQRESIHYSLPQSPHSTSNTDATAAQHTLLHKPMSQFSQYVSFYNPCPPVQDYVSSLQDEIDSLLTELNDAWPSLKHPSNLADTDNTLASKVDAFVSSIREAKSTPGIRDGEVTTACSSASQTAGPCRGGEAWQPHALKRFPDNAPPASHITLSVSTSLSDSGCESASSTSRHSPPNISPQSQQSHTTGINHTVRHARDNSMGRTLHFTATVESGNSLPGSSCELTLPGFSGVSKHTMEAPHLSETAPNLPPVGDPAPCSGSSPPATILSSLISQLQPEVFSNLVEIIKDVKRNSVQFYIHASEPGDQVYEEIKEHLLKQGNVNQSPVTFLSQENADSRLLVIIKNKDIAAHIHKIPGLVSLKRHPNVVFVGIDTLDDIMNNSYNELFVSGGCIISDEVVLNPDFITHDRLTALLMLLGQLSSPGSVWRWKVHCKTHKKLKEQSRFRRDAATLLDILSTYQKLQIIEFLPYHHCDMNERQSPDLDCVMALQARYTQYRHTIVLTERHFDKFPDYASGGIIMASVDEVLHDFTKLVGYHNSRCNQPVTDDSLAPKDHIHSHSSSDHQHLLQQSSPGLPPLSHLSDQLIPDASCTEGVLHHSGRDLEDLRLAISQLRAERLSQLQKQQFHQQQLQKQQWLPYTSSENADSILDQRGSTESVQLIPGNEAVAATLEVIHTALQLEVGQGTDGSVGRGNPEGGVEPGDQRDVQNNVVGTSHQTDSPTDRRQETDQRGEPVIPKAAQYCATSSGTVDHPVEGDRARDTQLVQEQPQKGEGAPPGNGTVGTSSGSKLTRSTNEDKPDLTATHPQHIPQSQPQLNERHANQSHLQPPAHRLQPHQLHHLHGQAFSRGPTLTPLAALRGGLLGRRPVWSGGLSPAGAAALVWGYQPGGMTLTGPGLLAGYHNPTGQASNRYRGGQRGGGFNGM